uniref:EOG090X0J9J n=1 Tax=Lynceus sp. MCZ IZ 141354 TaxID=1930659 RepID=A0A9N6WUM3_9CRUS|nr:EOG090X0J9J [Lynceus sp. MCZ IZ 141354]
MFEKTAQYLQTEMTSAKDEYALLEEMNKVTASKYGDLRQVAAGVANSLTDMNLRYEGLKPILDQIDHIEDSVTKLEQAAYKLDAYSKRLEAKFRNLEKQY